MVFMRVAVLLFLSNHRRIMNQIRSLDIYDRYFYMSVLWLYKFMEIRNVLSPLHKNPNVVSSSPAPP